MASSNIKIQYVTALYSLPERNVESILKDFALFLQSSYNIIVFTDIETLSSMLELDTTYSNSKNIQIVYLPKTELKVCQTSNEKTVLPTLRNVSKDTLSFLQLMNAKTEFLKRASDICTAADAYMWFDFGVLKISNNPSQFVKMLGRADESLSLHPEKIIIPGCKPLDSSLDFSQVLSGILWRFCGGVVLVPKSLVNRFHTLVCEQLTICQEKNVLTWEVNLWAWIETKHPELFQWYAADHNDSIVDFPAFPKQKRIIFLSMIKNESRIIKRCIEASLSVADAVCICDTGSTDTTVDILTEYFKQLPIPGRIYSGESHLWKNFEHNRSQSFLAAVDYCTSLGWDLEHTYALVLDADMQLKPQSLFNKQSLTMIGYKMIQKSSSLEYYNTRFMKLSYPWKCVGVTHEYWDGGNTGTITMDQMYILDIGDGGCKSDKFERDVRLLEQGLIDSPNNPRYLFYLAQSYKDSKQIDKSIEFYKKRIDAGGWYEEIWYSMYMIMKLYAEKKMYPEMEMWGMKAFEYRKERSENLLYLVRHFRDQRQHHKAWHYYQLGSGIKKPDDLLFIETEVYTKLFDYERAILHDYIFPERKKTSLDISIQYFNKWNEDFSYNNIEWFVTRIPGTVKKLYLQQIGDYVATSTCFCKQLDGMYRVNVRYVNYRIQPNGGYLMMENGVLNGDNPVRTKNYTCLMDSSFHFVGPLEEMVLKDAPVNEKHIKGLEDVRIFQKASASALTSTSASASALGKDDFYYLGTTMEYSYDGNIRQHMGQYNIKTHTFEESVSLKPPRDSGCEKNWIPYKGNKIIYGWHPFEIGSINDTNTLVIEKTQATPNFLRHMRGSSTLVEEGGYIWGLTHCVIYKAPRKYYHIVVKIDPENDKIVGYSDPFFFLNNAIEYCLGFEKQGSTYTTIVSQNDSTPVLFTFKDDDLRWRTI